MVHCGLPPVVEVYGAAMKVAFPSTPSGRTEARSRLWERRNEPHVAALVKFAEEIATNSGLMPGAVPYPDPDGGGVNARVLFLLNDPGDGAKSWDRWVGNADDPERGPDLAEATCGGRGVRTGPQPDVALERGAVASAERSSGSACGGGCPIVDPPVALLPDLRGIVALGATARRVTDEVQVISARARHLKFHHSTHPERSSNAALFEAYGWAANVASD